MSYITFPLSWYSIKKTELSYTTPDKRISQRILEGHKTRVGECIHSSFYTHPAGEQRDPRYDTSLLLCHPCYNTRDWISDLPLWLLPGSAEPCGSQGPFGRGSVRISFAPSLPQPSLPLFLHFSLLFIPLLFAPGLEQSLVKANQAPRVGILR